MSEIQQTENVADDNTPTPIRTSRSGITEDETRGLVYFHGKSQSHMVANFFTKVVAYFSSERYSGFVFEISLADQNDDRKWEVAFTMAQLNDSSVIKSILQEHCDEMLWYRVPRDAPGSVDLATYMFQQTRLYSSSEDRVSKKVAMQYPGWQDKSFFVVNDAIQVNAKEGKLIESRDKYVLYRSTKVAKEAKQHAGNHFLRPFSSEGVTELLVAFKQLLCNNYPAACLALGGVAMATGHARITEAYGSCPVIILSGDTETGKTTVLRSILSLVGNDGILKDYTGSSALERCRWSALPFGWDDPATPKDVSFIVQAIFQMNGRETYVAKGKPRGVPIISANFACENHKRIFSREGIILFQTATPQLPPKERRRCEAELRSATKNGSKGFLEVLNSVEMFFSPEGQNVLDEDISPRIATIFDGLLRSQSNYEKLTWFTFDMLRRAGKEEEMELVWEYLEDVLGPFIKRIYQESSAAMKVPEAEVFKTNIDAWDALTEKMRNFMPREVSHVCRIMKIKGVDCICLSLNFLNTVLRTPNDRVCIQQMECALGGQVQLLPYKCRQRFLSPESDQDHFKIVKGVDTIGKTEFLRALGIPENFVPASLKAIIKGKEASEDTPDDASRMQPRETETNPQSDATPDSVVNLETANKDIPAPTLPIAQETQGNVQKGAADHIVVQDNNEEGEQGLDDVTLINAAKEAESTCTITGHKRKQKRGNMVDSLDDGLAARERNLPTKRLRKKTVK